MAEVTSSMVAYHSSTSSSCNRARPHPESSMRSNLEALATAANPPWNTFKLFLLRDSAAVLTHASFILLATSYILFATYMPISWGPLVGALFVHRIGIVAHEY